MRYVEWDVAQLHALEARYPALANALNALLTRDLAHKLIDSYRHGGEPRGPAPAPIPAR